MWYERSQWTGRLVLERAVMERRFPQFVLKRNRDRGLYWEGIVSPTDDALFLVTIGYPANFPYREPVLRVLEPPIRAGALHLYGDGSLCTHRDAWDPTRGTAASQVPLLCDWLAHYLEWSERGTPY